MPVTEAYKEHIIYTFHAFCKVGHIELHVDLKLSAAPDCLLLFRLQSFYSITERILKL